MHGYHILWPVVWRIAVWIALGLLWASIVSANDWFPSGCYDRESKSWFLVLMLLVGPIVLVFGGPIIAIAAVGYGAGRFALWLGPAASTRYKRWTHSYRL